MGQRNPTVGPTVQCNLAFTRRRRAGALTESKAGKAARMKSMLQKPMSKSVRKYVDQGVMREEGDGAEVGGIRWVGRWQREKWSPYT